MTSDERKVHGPEKKLRTPVLGTAACTRAREKAADPKTGGPRYPVAEGARQFGRREGFVYNGVTVVYSRCHLLRRLKREACWASAKAEIESDGEVWLIF